MAATDEMTKLTTKMDAASSDAPSPEVIPVQGKRSFFLWLLFFAYALFSIAGWMRMIETFVDWYWLKFASIWPGPLYLAVTGCVWGVAGMTGVIWLWLRRRGACVGAFGVALFLALTYWTDRLLVVSLHHYGSNTWFAAWVTLFGLLFAYVVLQPWKDWRSFRGR